MSSLATIVPGAPLTDDVFPFNQSAFVEIQRYQKESVPCSYLKTHALTNSYNFPEI
jgi:hypothetical protein